MIYDNAVSILKDKLATVQSDTSTNILVGPIRLPVNLDGKTVVFQWYSWLPVQDEADRAACETATTEALIKRLSSLNLAEGQQSSVLVYGDFEHAEDALIRMHSICHTGDIFGSKRCDCGYQLEQSMKMIADNGAGALFYLANHEGRGIGLFSKAMAYILQENGMDTVEANLALGFVDDSRSYTDAISILKHLRQQPVTLITNNPKKLEALKASGMNVVKRVPLWGDVSEFNVKYLQTKVNRSGHFGQNEEILKNEYA
ncbi:GTP cyclohydrolase II [Paenibacillus sp. P96]|uniref:GTP cyclohydrolase II n=1 Tax=Paenibacillus zeirhizosphaerae TaxID=2987519 RepID=A0ABT9FXJ6_9BACL|nr:GTP cyclohydrolase II [Paenibacillus sp. P96]MDP4099354.1 GTP cyclohydrolase II [Paenibacillus sp. P96]